MFQVSLADSEEVKEAGPAAGERLWGCFDFTGITACHFQKIPCVKKGFNNWPRYSQPVSVRFQSKRLAGSVRNDLLKPVVERTGGQQGLQRRNNLFRQRLQTIDLETLMVEPVNRVFVAPMITALQKQFLQLLASLTEVFDQCQFVAFPFGYFLPETDC